MIVNDDEVMKKVSDHGQQQATADYPEVTEQQSSEKEVRNAQ
jgi:hypothetical protein